VRVEERRRDGDQPQADPEEQNSQERGIYSRGPAGLHTTPILYWSLVTSASTPAGALRRTLSAISLSPAARIGVAAGLTAIVLYQADAAAVLSAIDRTRPAPVAAAIALVAVDRAIMGWRWVALLGAVDADPRPPLAKVARVFFVSTFVGTFLPASIGGDAVRTVAAAQLGFPVAGAVAAAVLDRLLGVISMLLVAVAGLASLREVLATPGIAAGLSLTLAVSAAGLAVIFSERIAGLASLLARRVPHARAQRLAGDLVVAIRLYRHRHGLLAGVLAASIAVQALRVLEAWMLAQALSLPVSLTACFALVPVILLVMLLPITVNGIGTSQAAFVWLFGLAGVSAADAFALSILFVALGILGNLPGALLYASGPAPARKDT
jgi:uncharacterized protein (TIRG00374 family)